MKEERMLSTEEVFLTVIRANIKANQLDKAIKLIDKRKEKLSQPLTVDKECICSEWNIKKDENNNNVCCNCDKETELNYNPTITVDKDSKALDVEEFMKQKGLNKDKKMIAFNEWESNGHRKIYKVTDLLTEYAQQFKPTIVSEEDVIEYAKQFANQDSMKGYSNVEKITLRVKLINFYEFIQEKLTSK